MTAALYLSVLLCIGAGLHYYQARFNFPFPVLYLVVVLGIQFVFSAAIAMFMVASSISAEVMQRTLDFQRIVSLPPRHILLGKMLGEPAISYLLAIATLPLAVLCWHWGAASLLTIALLYVNLATSTLMAAAIGLIHPLVPPADKAGNVQKSASGSAQVLVGLSFFIAMQAVMVQGRAVLENSLTASLLGTFTPVPALWSLLYGNAWDASVPLWGGHLPSLCVAPIAQLFVTVGIVTTMSRKLRNPLNPPLTKPAAYALVTVVDLFVAALVYSHWADGYNFSRATAVFALVHLATGLLAMSLVTPSHDVLMTWVWRFRGRCSLARDCWLNDRSPNLLVLATLAVIGPVVYFAAFYAPVAYWGGAPAAGATSTDIVAPLAMTTMLLLSLGTMFQAVSALVRRGATVTFFFLLAALFVGPLFLGGPLAKAVLEELAGLDVPIIESLWGLSPLTHFAARIALLEHVPTLRVDTLTETLPALLAVYFVLFVLSIVLLWRWLSDKQQTVADKLADMRTDNTPAAPSTEMRGA